MATPKKDPKDILPAGRKTLYKQEYDEQVRKLCLLGLTDADLAKHFEIDETTLYEWKKVHPTFSQAIRDGKENADIEVADKLRNKATGFYEEEKYFPPDTTAAIFWLKNRHPRAWRDRVETEHSGEVNWNF